MRDFLGQLGAWADTSRAAVDIACSEWRVRALSMKQFRFLTAARRPSSPSNSGAALRLRSGHASASRSATRYGAPGRRASALGSPPDRRAPALLAEDRGCPARILFRRGPSIWVPSAACKAGSGHASPRSVPARDERGGSESPRAIAAGRPSRTGGLSFWQFLFSGGGAAGLRRVSGKLGNPGIGGPAHRGPNCARTV